MDFSFISGLRLSSVRRNSVEQRSLPVDFLPASELPSHASQEQLVTLLVGLAAEIQKGLGGVPGLLPSVCNTEIGISNIFTVSIGAGSSFSVRAVRNISERADERRLVFKSIIPSGHGYDQQHTTMEERRRIMDVLLELRALSHPTLRGHDNVVELLGLGWERDVFASERLWPVLILDYADGGTLKDLLNRQLLLSYTEKAHLCLDVMQGLSALHECGIIHGDIKLENVLAFTRDEYLKDESSRRWIAKLADFGGAITDVEEEGARVHALRTGTPPWNAPEWKSQLSRMQLTRTDVYSLGFLIWRLMAGGAHLFHDACQCFSSLSSLTDRAAFDTAVEALKKDGANFLASVQRAGRSKFCNTTNFEQVNDLLGLTLQFDPEQRDLTKAISVLKDFFQPQRNSISPQKQTSLELAENDFAAFATLAPPVRTFVKHRLQQVFHSNANSEQRSSAAYTIAIECLNDSGHWRERDEAQNECLHWLVEAARLENQSAQSLVYRFHKTFGREIPPKLAEEMKEWLILTTERGFLAAKEDLPDLASPDEYKAAIQTLRCRRNGIGQSQFGHLIKSRRFDVETTDTQFFNWLMVRKTTSIRDHYLNQGGDTLLHLAAAMGLYKGVLEWLEQRPEDLNQRGTDNETPLLHACRSGHGHIALALLEMGANASLSNLYGDTPFHWLLSFEPDQMDAIAVALCKNGGDPNALAKSLSFDFAPQNSFPAGSPLHRAVSRGNLAAVKALLNIGAKPNIPMHGDLAYPYTPLYLAAQCHYPDILEVLLSVPAGNQQSVVDTGGLSLMIPAIIGEQFLGERFSTVARHGPLWWQRAQRTLDLLMKLGGADHIHDLPGFPGCTALCLAAKQSDERIIEYLLDHGASSDLNVVSTAGPLSAQECTPLMMTIWHSRKEVFSLLLQRGADPQMLTPEADDVLVTTLYECSLMDHNDNYFAEQLIEAGVEVDARPTDYESAFALAVRHRSFHFATLLLKHGADPHLEFSCGSMIQLNYPCSLLGFLVLEGAFSTLPCLDYLFRLDPVHRPHFIVSSATGRTVLHFLAGIRETGRDDLACRAILLTLLKHFSPTVDQINQKADRGHTALHTAVFSANVETAMALVESGAREDVEDDAGFTPLDMIQVSCDGFKSNFDAQLELTAIPRPVREQIIAGQERRESILKCFERAAKQRVQMVNSRVSSGALSSL